MATTATVTLASDISASYSGYSKTMTLTKADTVEINELSEDENGIRNDVMFEKYLLLKGMKDPELESIEDVEKFYSKATPQIIDQILLGVYKCMAWTKEDQASVAEQFPEQ